MDISSTSDLGDLLKGVLIEFGHDDIAFLVFQEASIHRNRLTFNGSDTYSVDLHPSLGRLCRGGDSVVLVVLTISDHDDRAAVLTLGAEALDGCIYSVTDRRTLDRDGLGRNVREEHLGADIIRGDRQLDK